MICFDITALRWVLLTANLSNSLQHISAVTIATLRHDEAHFDEIGQTDIGRATFKVELLLEGGARDGGMLGEVGGELLSQFVQGQGGGG